MIGPPFKILVTPDEVSMENGNPVKFDVEVHDEADNITTQPKLNVVCRVCHKLILYQILLRSDEQTNKPHVRLAHLQETLF